MAPRLVGIPARRLVGVERGFFHDRLDDCHAGRHRRRGRGRCPDRGSCARPQGPPPHGEVAALPSRGRRAQGRRTRSSRGVKATPSYVTGHRFGDFAHTHRTSGRARPYAALWSTGKGDNGAQWLTLRLVPAASASVGGCRLAVSRSRGRWYYESESRGRGAPVGPA